MNALNEAMGLAILLVVGTSCRHLPFPTETIPASPEYLPAHPSSFSRQVSPTRLYFLFSNRQHKVPRRSNAAPLNRLNTAQGRRCTHAGFPRRHVGKTLSPHRLTISPCFLVFHISWMVTNCKTAWRGNVSFWSDGNPLMLSRDLLDMSIACLYQHDASARRTRSHAQSDHTATLPYLHSGCHPP